MLYFFHHYELPVIIQQAQLQQLLLRTHRGMAGMMGLAGIAALASGAAYHDAPGTATQASPPTTQSTTQTVQNTAQSTTQTSPSVSTAQTNTTHTGDVVPARNPETNSVETTTGGETQESALATPPTDDVRNTDKDNSITPSNDPGIKIEEIARRNDTNNMKIEASGNSAEDTDQIILPSGASGDLVNETNVKDETSTLDRRRKENYITDLNNDRTPLVPIVEVPTAERLAPRASPEADDLD